MVKLLISLFFVYNFFCTEAQKLKTITKNTPIITEEFQVLNSDKNVKYGSYNRKLFSGIIMTKGLYENNIKKGIWEFFDFRTGTLEQKCDYDNDSLTFSNVLNVSNLKFKYNGDWINGKLDRLPELIGGLSSLKVKIIELDRIYNFDPFKPIFPKAGYTLFSFIITKNGEVTDPKIVQSPGNSFEKEIINAIGETSTNWKPALYHGNPVDVEFKIGMIISYTQNSDELKSYLIYFE
ncbi:MAG: energy transducer TonB [Bacteroidales bacterium]